MNSWGPAPSGSALWSTGPPSMPAWPPYNLPSDYKQPSSSTLAQQTHYTQETAIPSGQSLHGPVPQIPEQSTPQQSSNGAAAMTPGVLTTVPQQPTQTTYRAPYSVHNQSHGGIPLESFFTAHLQYPKTWVHLWDRLPLREPETLISSETSDRRIRLCVYNDTYEGEKGQQPLKVDTFVSVKKTLPPKEKDDIAAVSSLASAFQAACNTSSLPRLCHLLPMQLTAELGTRFESAYPRPESETNQTSEPPVQLSGTLLQPNVSVSLTQLHCMKVLQCMLSARLMHGGAESEDERFRSGVLSIEQSRSLVPLLHADPMANKAPLVGIWVSGVTSITNSLVLSAALAFHTSNAKRTKAVAPDGSFLVLAFLSSSTKVPEVYEACLTSSRGVPLMPFSVNAQLPAPVDPILRALSSSPNPDSQAQAERNKELQNLSNVLLIERPHLLYSLFVDSAPQAAASALATVSVPGGTASANVSTSALTGTRHVQHERASAASLSAWRTDAPLHELATSGPAGTYAGPAGTASGTHAPLQMGTSGGFQSTANISAHYPGSFQSMAISSTPSSALHLQGAAAAIQGTDATGLQIGESGQVHGASGTAVPNALAPQTGLPPVPSPSPLVGQSMTPLHSHTHATQQSAAKTPALGMADRAPLHALPGAAITGPGPLSVGSMSFSASTAPTIPRAGRYGPLFANQPPAGVATVPPQHSQVPHQATQPSMAGVQGVHATPVHAAMQDSGASSMHSNIHALFVGTAPTPNPSMPSTNIPSTSAAQPPVEQGPAAAASMSMGASQSSTVGAAPASAISGSGSGAVGVPEWLASAVHRHPDLAPLLRNQAAIVAKEGSITAETPADGGTPAAASTAHASVTGDTSLAGLHSYAAENSSIPPHACSGLLQCSGQYGAVAAGAPGDHAALVALLNDSAAPSAATSDVYNHLIAPQPDARDLASTRRTSFADDPSINGSVLRGMQLAPGNDTGAPEATAAAVVPTDARGAESQAEPKCLALELQPGCTRSQLSVQNIEDPAPTCPPTGLAPVAVPHRQQHPRMPEMDTQNIAEDCTQYLSQPMVVCSRTCAQEGPSTPRAKRGTCEAHSSSKKQRVSPPYALLSKSPTRPSPGSMQHRFHAAAARGRVGASDALIHMHSSNVASSLAHLPVPSLPVSATQDPETASALAPLYDYIGKLRQHIALLQDQVCQLSGCTTRDPPQGTAEQCSQSMAALHISEVPGAQPLQGGLNHSSCAPSHAAVAAGCVAATFPPPSAPNGATLAPAHSQQEHSIHAAHPAQHASHAATDYHRNAAAALNPGAIQNSNSEQLAAQPLHSACTHEPAYATGGDVHVPGGDQNDALDAIVDAFLVSSAGGVHDNLPEYPQPIRTTVQPTQASSHGQQAGHARQKVSDVNPHSQHQTAFRSVQNRAPFSPRSLNVPQSEVRNDVARNAAYAQSNAAGSVMGTPAADAARDRMGERGSVAPSECPSSAGGPPWGGSVRAETAALAASRDGSARSVRTPPPAEVQDGRRAHERSASGATCLSPELAALIRDAEHVEGQEYEDSLCLREETSVSEANASSRYRSSNGGVLEADHGTRASRRIRRDVESEDADDVGSDTEEDANQALVRSATASVQKYSKLTGRTSELMQRAEKLTRSQGATSSKGGVQTPVPVHNPKRRGSAAGASSANGQAHSSRTAESLAGRASAAVALPKTYADVPRIQLPATSAGKKALKSLMKDKGMKKVLRNTNLIEEKSDTNEDDTSTSFSDDEEMQLRLEKKYGIRS